MGPLLLFAVPGCDAFEDEVAGDGFAGPVGSVAAGAGGLSPGGSAPPSIGGIGGGGGLLDAAPQAPLDAGAAAPDREAGSSRQSACPGNPPACEVLVTEPVETEQACVFELRDLRVDAVQACRGEVVLAGESLGCGDGDGWTLTADGRLLVLLGRACQSYDALDASLHAAFPCDAACRVVPEGGETPSDGDGGVD